MNMPEPYFLVFFLSAEIKFFPGRSRARSRQPYDRLGENCNTRPAGLHRQSPKCTNMCMPPFPLGTREDKRKITGN